MLVLLRQTNQLWICSQCRHEQDHQAMDSMDTPNCSTCGMAMAASVRYYCVNWIRGLMTRSDFSTSGTSATSACSLRSCSTHTGSRLACPGLSPTTNLGKKATCPCEKGKPSKSAKATGNVDSGNDDGENSRAVEDMDTAEGIILRNYIV